MRQRVAWDDPRAAITRLGRWRIAALFEPMRGEWPGGDRFSVDVARDRTLAFYVADATGHGRTGAVFWQTFGGLFQEAWTRFISDPTEPGLMRFAREMNDVLHEGRGAAGSAFLSAQLCIGPPGSFPPGCARTLPDSKTL